MLISCIVPTVILMHCAPVHPGDPRETPCIADGGLSFALCLHSMPHTRDRILTCTEHRGVPELGRLQRSTEQPAQTRSAQHSASQRQGPHRAVHANRRGESTTRHSIAGIGSDRRAERRDAQSIRGRFCLLF